MTARSEAAMRVALGASRVSVIREALTRGTVLALLGGIAGVGLAFGGTRMLRALDFRGAKYVPIEPNPSQPVLVFAFALSLLTGIFFR
jgi:macrolide transport system ATP-binding/permease protein